MHHSDPTLKALIRQTRGLRGICTEQVGDIYYLEKCKQDFKEQAHRLQHTLVGKGRLK